MWNLAALGVPFGPEGPKALGSPEVLEGPKDLRGPEGIGGPDPEGLGGQEETSRISEKSRCRRSRRSWTFGMSGTLRRCERSMRLCKSGLMARISNKLIKSKIFKYQRVTPRVI